MIFFMNFVFNKSNSDICKIRIDFDTLVLADPFSTTATAVLVDGGQTGKCKTDTLQVNLIQF